MRKNVKLWRILSVFFCMVLCVGPLVSCEFLDRPSVSEETVDPEADLDMTQDEVYQTFEKAIEKFENEIILYNVKGEDAASIYFQVLNDHPEYFWVTTGYRYKILDVAGHKKVVFRPVMSKDTPDQIAAKKERLNKIVSAVLSDCEEIEGDYEKLLFLHDRLIQITDYDDETAESIITSRDADYTYYEGTSAYGCLVNGLAVCSGYAGAYQLLVNRIGLECRRITGNMIRGDSHEWNYVKLGEKYYYIDPTWDDTDSISGTNNWISHEFFCITLEELLETHTIDNGQFIPVCLDDSQDYYRKHGCYMEEYSFEVYSDIVSSGHLAVKFADAETCRAACEDLMENRNIFEIPYIAELECAVRYVISETGKILVLYPEG